MVAYTDVFHLMFLATLSLIPVVLMMRKPACPAANNEAAAVD